MRGLSVRWGLAVSEQGGTLHGRIGGAAASLHGFSLCHHD
ncbi:MAG: hypothetical protein ACJAUE_000502 [Alcanivorax sp.]|jgi:hypothetical protein|nr:hypothetical protein ADG881_1471 [Alcanivorax sp. DG881]